MTSLPLISIVVPSYNQAQYLPETLQSLLDQEYPALEVIVQDGGSTDGSVEIAQTYECNYPHIFRVFVEKDDGQADAINKGFARTHGEIMAFLNSDDTYFPKILHNVAAEIDPQHNRFIVVGRCIFTGEGSNYVGVEHPTEYTSHFEQLAIWKRGFNTIPQPSVFWHRQVWDRCGGLDVNEQHALDYDLFCRFSAKYVFHCVDELWSTYRMHDASKSSQRTEAEVLELSIQVSKKHWGSWLSPLRWRCELSHWWYRRNAHERARHHARRADEAFRNKKVVTALYEFVQTLFFSPTMARDRLLFSWLTGRQVWFLNKLVSNYGFTDCYPDGWIGPHYRIKLTIPQNAQQLAVNASFYPHPAEATATVKLIINGTVADSKSLGGEASFVLEAPMQPYHGKAITIEVQSSFHFVPADIFGGSDMRMLSLRLGEVSVVT